MDEYHSQLDELKVLVSSALEKKGYLSQIRADLRAKVFEVIEEQDQLSGENARKAVIGTCNDQAKALHATKAGQLVTSLICEYLEWADLNHTLKVFLPECNLPKTVPKRVAIEEELGVRTIPASSAGEGTVPAKPLLLEVLEAFLNSQGNSGRAQGLKGTSQWGAGSSANTINGGTRSGSPARRSASPLKARSSSPGPRMQRAPSPTPSRGGQA